MAYQSKNPFNRIARAETDEGALEIFRENLIDAESINAEFKVNMED